MKKPVMMETMNGILAVVVVPVVVAGMGTVVVGAVVVAGMRTVVVVGAVVVAGRRAVVVGLVVVAGTTTAVVGLVVVAGTTTAVVGLVVALVIIIVWSMRRKMRITMKKMVGTMALEFVVATIMMMAAIEGQAAAIAVVMIAAGRVALRTHGNEAAKMYCLYRY
ncbi:MAG: hypothetical protein WBE34_20840 [Candidatus Nitrosopolaris sp.]